MSQREAKRFMTRMLNVSDPAFVDHISSGRMHELGITRLMTDQLPLQRVVWRDIPRALSILLDPDGDSLLGEASWNALLGVPLPSFLPAVSSLATLLGQGPLDLDAFFASEGDRLYEQAFRETLKYLGWLC